MRRIERDGKIYAIYSSVADLEKGAKWYSENTDGLQVGSMFYDKGKIVKPHIHKFHPRSINHTQECFVVIKGKIELSFYDQDKAFLEKVILNSGGMAIAFRGYHGMRVIEDGTVFYEIKNGPFTEIESDKEFMDS